MLSVNVLSLTVATATLSVNRLTLTVATAMLSVDINGCNVVKRVEINVSKCYTYCNVDTNGCNCNAFF